MGSDDRTLAQDIGSEDTVPVADRIDDDHLNGDTLATVPVATHRSGPIQSGTSIGRFVVMNELGSGGMGTVVAAFDPQLDRKVAIKVIRPDFGSGDAAELAHQRLLREAQAMAQLNHPNVATVYEVGAIDGGVFVAMEYIRGKTLRQWQDEADPGRAELLDRYIAAGRGLAAGHDAGLVHRDFKPENAIVGDDGIVRVIDFGLAVPSGEERRRSVPPELSQSTLDTPLTETGTVQGTPRFMAPEQFFGGALDGRSDQFAFCVSLFEGLFGTFPFEGDTYGELSRNVTTGQIRLPAGRSISRRLLRIIARGLENNPNNRHPDMKALLSELERVASPARRGPILAVAAVAATAAVGIAVAVVGPRDSAPAAAPDACENAGERADRVWTDVERDTVRAAFVATQVPYAGSAFSRVDRALAAQIARWKEARVEMCRAHARNEHSDEVFATQVTCIDRRLADVRAVVAGGRAVVDAAGVDRIRERASALRDLSECVLPGAVALPETAELTALRARMEEAGTLDVIGDHETARAISAEVAERARQLGDHRLAGRAYAMLGNVELARENSDAAEAAFQEAVRSSQRANDTTTVAATWVKLMGLVVLSRQRADEALRLSVVVETAIEHAGSPPRLQGEYQLALGVAHKSKGSVERAVEHYEAARKIYEAEPEPDYLALARAYNNLGIAMRIKKDVEAAIEYHTRALEARETELGPDHPDVAYSLNNLAIAWIDRNDLETARKMFERALEIRQAAFGDEHPDVAISLLNLGEWECNHGDRAKGLAKIQTAIETLETTRGADHPHTGYARDQLTKCPAE